MKFRLLFIASFTFLSYGYAQQVPVPVVTADTSFWNVGGLNALTFSQVTLNNWASGGQSSISINAFSGLFADYEKDRTIWDNSLDLGYGLVRQGKEGEFTKADDRINLVSKYGYQISPENNNWYFSGLLDFRTQFTPGYATVAKDTVISRFLAPGYLTTALGVDYRPSESLSVNYSPIAGKFTIVNDDELSGKGAYGVEEGNKFRAELGSYFRVKFNDEIFENVTFESRLELFSNYLENFGVIDVNWQNGLVMKVNDVLTANFSTHLIYDKDIDIEHEDDSGNIEVGPRVQFKSVFGAGFAYSFGATRSEEEE